MPACVACKNSTRTSRRSQGKSVTFFAFPKDDGRLQQWLVAVRNHLRSGWTVEKIREMCGTNHVNHQARICSEHFSPTCCTENMKTRFLPGYKTKHQKFVLSENAVPTLFGETKLRESSDRQREKRDRKKLIQSLLEVDSTIQQQDGGSTTCDSTDTCSKLNTASQSYTATRLLQRMVDTARSESHRRLGAGPDPARSRPHMSQGMTVAAESQTCIVPPKESSTKVTRHAAPEGCFPVKVDYVGPGCAISDSSQDPNDAGNMSLSLQPVVCHSKFTQDTWQSSNGAADTSVALPSAHFESTSSHTQDPYTETVITVLPPTPCHTQDPLTMLTTATQQVAMNVGDTVQTSGSSNTCQNCSHADGEMKSNEVQSPQYDRCTNQVVVPTLEEPVFPEGSETAIIKAAKKRTVEVTRTPVSCRTSEKALHIDRKKKPSDSYLPYSAKCVKEELEPMEETVCAKNSVKYSSNNGTTDTSSQLGTVGIHVKEEDKVEMDLGDCADDVSSQLSCKLEKEFENYENTSDHPNCSTENITVKKEAEMEANISSLMTPCPGDGMI